MKSAWGTVVVSVAMVASVAAAGPAEDVKSRYAVMSAAVAAKDMNKLVALYADGATLEVLTPTGGDRVTGLESVMNLWAGALQGGAVTFEVVVADAAVKGTVLTEKGTFVMKKKDGAVFLKGAYNGSWRREKDTWKLTNHLLNGK